MGEILQFGLLGTLEVVDGSGGSVDLGGLQPRTVLAVLLVAGGRVVTADTVLDELWGDDPPATATGTLQSYVSRLRRVLERGAGGNGNRLLLWEPPGYRLAVAPEAVDFRRFEVLADEGRSLLAGGRHEEARRVLSSAEALWRGPALAEFRDRDFAAGLARRLEERRLAATEDRIAADLALGRHAATVGELSELVDLHPLREELRAHLAVALYRAGRQAEALRTLADAGRTLREELGIEPGRPLQELESAILAQDPRLDAPPVVAARAPAPVPGPPAADGAPTLPASVAPQGMIGRRAELATLLGALEEAMTGATRAVVIEGEPGIGKTRLAEELGAEAARRGATVLWGRAFEGGAAPAFWPWLAPLRALGAALPPGTAPAELAGLLSASGGASAPAAGDRAGFVVFEGVAAVLAAGATAAPLVLVLDDVQWADEASLELLSLVAARLDAVPLLVVCTVRELEVGRNDALVDALAALTRRPGTRRLRLLGLSGDATAELVARTVGAAVDAGTAGAIHRRAEGNPFFISELSRLVAAGAVGDDVPSGVRDVVRRRLALLPDPTTELLEVAAVIGRDVDVGLLVRASGRDLDDCLDALDPAVAHRLLAAAEGQPGIYRFAHALVREVMVDGITSLRRARLHLRVADALHDTDDTAEILAEHLWEAAPIGTGARAAAALERAARVAVQRLAYASAQHLLERAVQLRRAAGSSRADQEAELDALVWLMSVTGARHGYAAHTGSPAMARAKVLAQETGRRLALLQLLWTEWAGLDTGCHHERADAIAAELLALSRTLDEPVAAVVGHTAWGISRWHRGVLRESAEHLDAAREAIVAGLLFDDLFDVDQLRLASPFATYVHDLLGDLDDPERRFDQVVAELAGNGFWELLVMNFAASGAMSVGDYGRAERAARRGRAADPEGISAFWSVAGEAYLGVALCLQGRLDEGLPMFDQALVRYLGMGLRTNRLAWLSGRTEALASAGRVEEAEASLADARSALAEDGERYAEPLLRAAEASVASARGADGPEVEKPLREALDLCAAQGASGVARRIRATAARLGVDVHGSGVERSAAK